LQVVALGTGHTHRIPLDGRLNLDLAFLDQGKVVLQKKYPFKSPKKMDATASIRNVCRGVKPAGG
jgi:hypothetical protein